MALKIESRLGKIETEIKEIKRAIYVSRSKKRFIKAAGSWKGVNTEKLKKKIYKSRKDASRKVEF